MLRRLVDGLLGVSLAMWCLGGVLSIGSYAQEKKPLEFDLPKPQFIGTPKEVPPGTRVEPPSGQKPPVLMVPKDTVLISQFKPVNSSDEEPIIGELDLVTDGDKEAQDGCYVELGPMLQWVQIDLEQTAEIHAIVVWHYHSEARVYHDVVVQLADDPDFITNVRTVFNNDHDNSSGLGVGDDYEYFETNQGKVIDAQGFKARYVRLYSNGNTSNEQNHYTEVEVYGIPVE